MCLPFVTSRLRQSPAYPSDPVQPARFLQVGVPRTGHAVLWKLTISSELDHCQRQSEDVNSHQLTVTTKLQYLRTRTGAAPRWRPVVNKLHPVVCPPSY